ncbi:SRPBCC domain-containing protein [Paenibacillus tarimensis]
MNDQKQAALPDIRKHMVFNASIRKVWEAVSTSEGIATWFMPNDFQAEIGYEFQMDAGPYGMTSCKVTVLDPPNRLSFTWGEDWTLTFELIEQGDRTEFTLIHSGWNTGNAVVRDRMDHGWGELQYKLRDYVEGQ